MAGAKLLKTLTLFQVVVMGLAYLTPMAVFDTFAIVGDITDGRVATAYLFALIGMLFTAMSYGHLVRKFPSAGSAYTYAQKVFHPYVGFMVGWVSLLDYMFMPMINILLAKIYLTAMFPGVDPWIFIFALVTVMTFLNLRGIKLVANLNGFIVFIQIAIILTFLGLIAWGLSHGEGAGTLMSSRPFHVESASMLPLFTGAGARLQGKVQLGGVVEQLVFQQTLQHRAQARRLLACPQRHALGQLHALPGKRPRRHHGHHLATRPGGLGQQRRRGTGMAKFGMAVGGQRVAEGGRGPARGLGQEKDQGAHGRVLRAILGCRLDSTEALRE